MRIWKMEVIPDGTILNLGSSTISIINQWNNLEMNFLRTEWYNFQIGREPGTHLTDEIKL